MNNPLISIIVPVYKVAENLDDCIKSIVAQTYKELEIILVDDGSPDNCPEICDSWAQKDARIKVIHKENGGASSARNAALDIASGDYLGFVDGDDYIAENMYEEMLNSLLTSNKEIAYCSAYRLFPDGTLAPQRKESKPKAYNVTETADMIFYGKIDTAIWSKLFKKSVFDGIRFPQGESNEEFPVLIPLINKADGLVDTGKILYYYRIRNDSITSTCYLKEESSGLVHKNLLIIKEQLAKYNLKCNKSYKLFVAKCSFNTALAMEKKYEQLSEKIRNDYRIHKKNMSQNFFTYIFSNHVTAKDKVLYCLVITKLLRPLYKIFYRDHL